MTLFVSMYSNINYIKFDYTSDDLIKTPFGFDQGAW